MIINTSQVQNDYFGFRGLKCRYTSLGAQTTVDAQTNPE